MKVQIILSCLTLFVCIVQSQPGRFLYTYEIKTPVITNKIVRDESCVTCLPSEKTKTVQELSYQTHGYAVYQTQPAPGIWDTLTNRYEMQNQRYYGGMRQYQIY